MEKERVLLVDEHDAFVRRAASRLRLHAAADYELHALSPVGLERVLREGDGGIPCLIIAPPAWERPRIPGLDLAGCTTLHWGEGSVPRYAGAGEMDRIIRQHLPDRGGRRRSRTSSCRLGCHLSFSVSSGPRFNAHVFDREMAAGKRLIYLPLKPLFRMTDSFRRGPEVTLGDLLCLIAAGEPPDARGLGTWLYLHERGYFTFRLPDRADDLVSCDRQDLKVLVGLLADYAASGIEPTVVWIDPEGLFLDKLLAIAVLCDFIYIEVPDGKSSASALAKRELSLFLADLPKSCVILELPGKGKPPDPAGLDTDGKRADRATRL